MSPIKMKVKANKDRLFWFRGLVISMLDSGGDGAGDISLKAPAAVMNHTVYNALSTNHL